jgi:hypothetical protein
VFNKDVQPDKLISISREQTLDLQSSVPPLLLNLFDSAPTDLMTDLSRVIYLKKALSDFQRTQVTYHFRKEGWSQIDIKVLNKSNWIPYGEIHFSPLLNGEFAIKKIKLIDPASLQLKHRQHFS